MCFIRRHGGYTFSRLKECVIRAPSLQSSVSAEFQRPELMVGEAVIQMNCQVGMAVIGP